MATPITADRVSVYTRAAPNQILVDGMVTAFITTTQPCGNCEYKLGDSNCIGELTRYVNGVRPNKNCLVEM